MGWADALGGIAGGVMGGMIGGSPNGESSQQSQVQDLNLRDINALNVGRSNLEASATSASEGLFSSLNQLTAAGPGMSDVQAGLSAQQGYGNVLQQQLSQGGLPSQAQIGAGQQYAQSIFAPQQVMLQQQFNQERVNQQRLAARLGRRTNDPVLANKMAFSQGQLQQQLQAQQGAFASQTAMSLPEKQAAMAERLAQVRGGLATQALQNRTSLLTMGQQLAASERQYRIATARHKATSSKKGSSGGGEGGMLSGVMGGIGQFGQFFGDMASSVGTAGYQGTAAYTNTQYANLTGGINSAGGVEGSTPMAGAAGGSMGVGGAATIGGTAGGYAAGLGASGSGAELGAGVMMA